MHYLLDNFADVNSQNKAGETPLFLAAEAYNRECAKVNNFLFNNYLLVNLINDCREIIFLSFHNSRRLILIFSHLKLLLEYGASVTVKNKMKLNVIQNCKSDDYRLYLEGNSKFSSERSLYKGNFDRLFVSRLEIHIQTDRLIYLLLGPMSIHFRKWHYQ